MHTEYGLQKADAREMGQVRGVERNLMDLRNKVVDAGRQPRKDLLEGFNLFSEGEFRDPFTGEGTSIVNIIDQIDKSLEDLRERSGQALFADASDRFTGDLVTASELSSGFLQDLARNGLPDARPIGPNTLVGYLTIGGVEIPTTMERHPQRGDISYSMQIQTGRTFVPHKNINVNVGALDRQADRRARARLREQLGGSRFQSPEARIDDAAQRIASTQNMTVTQARAALMHEWQTIQREEQENAFAPAAEKLRSAIEDAARRAGTASDEQLRRDEELAERLRTQGIY